jgi:serine/threonine protein kinase
MPGNYWIALSRGTCGAPCLLGQVRILGQFASAHDAAHEERLVHRDVKPANMPITARMTSNTALTDCSAC